MPYTWITPKTNWKASDYITYTDYNRIRNNLLYINDQLNAMFPEKAQTLDLGSPKTGYSNVYHASEFNAFEDALESFARVGENVSVGTKNVYKPNAPFIGYKELNRLESCCLKWKTYEPSVESVSMSPEEIKIKVGETQQMTINIVPSSASYTVTYKCDNTTAATVNANGLVTGVGDGQYTITATVKSGKKTFTLTSSGRIQTETVGSFFYFNNTKYFFDLYYVRSDAYAFDTKTNGSRWGYYLMPVYRTSALAGKWGTRNIPELWNDKSADYRTPVEEFIEANCSEQLKKVFKAVNMVYLSSKYAHTALGYQIQYCNSGMQTSRKITLPSPQFYGIEFPSNADPTSKTGYNKKFVYTDDIINGIPLISGEDRGQLMPVRLQNGDDYTMARLLNGVFYSADYEEVLPLRPVLGVPSQTIYVYPTPNDDGSYSIDWKRGKGSIVLSKLPLGSVIRDDTGTGRTG